MAAGFSFTFFFCVPLEVDPGKQKVVLHKQKKLAQSAAVRLCRRVAKKDPTTVGQINKKNGSHSSYCMKKPINFKSFLYLPINHNAEFLVAPAKSIYKNRLKFIFINKMRHRDFCSKNISSSLFLRSVE